MSELVCLNCGKDMEYDWAPCQNCDWKAPEPWEMIEEDDELIPQKPALARSRSWIQIVAWILLLISLVGLISYLCQINR